MIKAEFVCQDMSVPVASNGCRPHGDCPMPFLSSRPHLLGALLASLLLAACDQPAPGNGGPDMAPPEVKVEVVQPQRVVVKAEWPGRVQARRTAEVRARVEGIIQERLFTEGSEVKAGDLLFQIDPATLRAVLDATKANVARAEADLAQAQLKQKRLQNLLARNAVSPQEYDEAFARAKQAEADVAAAKAAHTRSSIDLDYAAVRAPITGRIGRALVTEGALVGKNEATHLATVEQLDPLYVHFTQSRSEMLRFRRQRDAVPGTSAQVRVLLQDGSTYGHEGKLLFSEMTVDPGTGEVLLRAEVPNPDRMLLPGMLDRKSVEQAVYEQAFTVSQRALIRSAQCEMVMTVLPYGKVVP